MAIIFGSQANIQEDFNQSFFDALLKGTKEVLDSISGTLSSAQFKSKDPVFVGDGTSNVPGTSFIGSSFDVIDDFQRRQITTQKPSLTVYIKKRAFGALQNENDAKYLDYSEKLFLRATKLLFEKKCQQIAAYESLTKARKLLDDESELDYNRVNEILDFMKETNDLQTKIVDADIKHQQSLDPQIFRNRNKNIEELNKTKDQLKNNEICIDGLYKLANMVKETKVSGVTNWVIDHTSPDVFLIGRGTGVIELTLINDLNTSLSIDNGSLGSIDFTIQDPYNLFKITNSDIESAINAAIKEIESDSEKGFSIKMGPEYYLNLAQEAEQKLKDSRKNHLSSIFGISSNTSLSGTDAPEVIFEVNLNADAANAVVAYMGDSEAFNEKNFRLMTSYLPIEQQLTNYEGQLLTEIFNNLNLYVTELKRINNIYIELNKSEEVYNARRNLRVHYLGKCLIQPMDSIDIFIKGGTTYTSTNYYSFNQLLENYSVGGLTDFNNIYLPDYILQEEMKVLGIDDLNIPIPIYRNLRTNSFLKNAGHHVFGGVVTNATESYSAESGIYTTKISGKNNMYWLDQSRTNEVPSLDQTQGVLEDPITPLDIKVDDATGLIIGEPTLSSENKKRQNEGIINYNSGIFAGKKSTEDNIIQDYIPDDNGKIIRQYKHSPGLVYKWKQGVIVATRNVNLKTSLSGNEDGIEKLRRDMGLTVVSNPFAGQDAANIVSILVTGFPYNYESFYEISMSYGTSSFFKSFFDINKTQNRTLGNFQPFKTIKTDPTSFKNNLSLRKTLSDTAKDLTRLRSELAKYKDRLISLEKIQFNETTDLKIKESIKKNIDLLQEQIAAKSEEFRTFAAQGKEAGLRIYGNDIAFAANGNTISKNIKEPTKEEAKQQFLEMFFRNTILQHKTQYDCKMNKDKNLFIVGDEYDKDLDIQAFVANITSNFDLWKSSFKTPRDICVNVSDILDFEFFCNTDGHIEFRPPRYNKTPLSLLLKMVLLQEKTGTKLYPPFLESLIDTQVKSLDREIKSTELNIKIELILLGQGDLADKTFDEIEKMVLSANEISFIEKPQTKDFGNLAIKLIKYRNELRSETYGSQAIDSSNEKNIQDAQKEINEFNDPNTDNLQTKRLSKIQRLAQLVGKMQLLKERFEKAKINKEKLPNITKMTKSIESLAEFGDIIENDYIDFFGTGAAQRFIINDNQVLRYDFSENGEEVICRVDVNGEQDLIGDGPGNIGQIPLLWAGATDFDLWRQYGYKTNGGGISRPFFKDAETQCAPYALALLNKCRKDILKGTVTLIGNEYYRLGDVVYLNCRDMLFYVTGVSHSFSYDSGVFTTMLTLRYGRTVGEFIPTPLDVIGKSIIKNNKIKYSDQVSREVVGDKSGIHLGMVIFTKDADNSSEEACFKDMLGSNLRYFNINELKNSLLIADIHLRNRDTASEIYPRIDLRGFLYDRSSENIINNRINAVRSWFKAPKGEFIKYKKLDSEETEEMFLKIDKKILEKIPNPSMDFTNFGKDQVINLNDKQKLKTINKYRGPKEEVFGIVPMDAYWHIELVVEIVLVFDNPMGN